VKFGHLNGPFFVKYTLFARFFIINIQEDYLFLPFPPPPPLFDPPPPDPPPELDCDPLEKLAFTAILPVTDIVHKSIPVQLPVQPSKDQPFPGVAVSVTTVPGG
jgi:hypothetical protein